jgi:hypothetical protein
MIFMSSPLTAASAVVVPASDPVSVEDPEAVDVEVVELLELPQAVSAAIAPASRSAMKALLFFIPFSPLAVFLVHKNHCIQVQEQKKSAERVHLPVPLCAVPYSLCHNYTTNRKKEKLKIRASQIFHRVLA